MIVASSVGFSALPSAVNSGVTLTGLGKNATKFGAGISLGAIRFIPGHADFYVEPTRLETIYWTSATVVPANSNIGVTLTGLAKTAAFGGHTPGGLRPWAKIAYAIQVSRFATCTGEIITTFDIPAPITALVTGYLDVDYKISGAVTLTSTAEILGNLEVNYQFPVTAGATITGEILTNFLRRGSQQAECQTGEGPPEIEGEEKDYVF